MAADQPRERLWKAISENSLKKVQKILSSGGLDLNEPYIIPHSGNKTTYLLQACVESSPVVAFALVKAGANVDTSERLRYYNYSATALILAVIQRKVDLVKKLLHRCDADVNATNDEGLAPLHFIINLSGESPLKKYHEPFKYSDPKSTEERVQVTQLLLSAGATVDLQDKKGRTPLYLAALAKDVATAKLLLRHRARVNIPDDEGMTPIHKAAKALDIEMFNLLTQHVGVESSTVVNLAANDGTTPLHAAIEAMTDQDGADNDTTFVRFLINRGADVTAKTHHLTPLHLAAEGGLLNCVKVLVEAGADIYAETPNTCLTPLDMAEHRNREDVVDYLAARQESDARGGEKMKREEPSVEQEEDEEQSQKSDAPVEEGLEGAVGGFEEVLIIKEEGNEG